MPQPQLLLGLPPLALQTVLTSLSAADKAALLCTCQTARTAVLQHSPRLKFSIKPGRRAAAHSALRKLLSNRNQRLHLVLDVQHNHDVAAMARMLKQLAAQQYPTHSGRCCVTDLEILLPEVGGSWG